MPAHSLGNSQENEACFLRGWLSKTKSINIWFLTGFCKQIVPITKNQWANCEIIKRGSHDSADMALPLCCQKLRVRLIKEQLETCILCRRNVLLCNNSVYVKRQLPGILFNFKYLCSITCLSSVCTVFFLNSLLLSFKYKINAASLQSVFSLCCHSQDILQLCGIKDRPHCCCLQSLTGSMKTKSTLVM